jgi:CHASE3 domain sensor protein
VPLTLYEKVSLNFGSGVVAVAIIGTLTYVSLGTLAASSREVGDTQAVLEQVDAVRSAVSQADRAQRDYLLGGAAEDRDAFERASITASRAVGRLQTIARLDSDVRRRVDSLAPLVSLHLGELDRIAQVRKQAGAEAAGAMRGEDLLASNE